MRFALPFVVFAVVLPMGVPQTSFAQNSGGCAATEAPATPFVPPPEFGPAPKIVGPSFLYGTPGLWAYVVRTHWKLHGYEQNKLPYFSQSYNWKAEPAYTKMVVLARRLDAPAPLVWSDVVNGAGPSHGAGEPEDLSKPGFMVTALDIPTAGCWEISARYTVARGLYHTLSYTVLVEE